MSSSIEQPVTGSNQAEAVCWCGGIIMVMTTVVTCLYQVLLYQMLVVDFAASHLLWLHTVFLQNLPILGSHDAY